MSEIRNAVSAFLTFRAPERNDAARQTNWTMYANTAINLIAARWREHHSVNGTLLQMDGDVVSGGIRGNMMYGIQSSVQFKDGRSRQLPHWYLNGDVQGIMSASKAAEFAARLLSDVNPDAGFYIYAQCVGTGEAAMLDTNETPLMPSVTPKAWVTAHVDDK